MIIVGEFGNVFSLPCLCTVISLWALIRSAAHVEQQAGHIHTTPLSLWSWLSLVHGDCSSKSVLCIVFVSLIFRYFFFLMSMILNRLHDSGNLNISPVEVSDPWAVQQSNIQSNIFSYTVYDYFLAALHLPNPCFESFTWLVITFVWPLPYFG